MAEIATSSVAIDLGVKRNAYRRNGVQEYLVWSTFENCLSWFRLQAEEFILIEPDADGMIRSSVFPGLWLNVPALLESKYLGTIKKQMQNPVPPAARAAQGSTGFIFNCNHLLRMMEVLNGLQAGIADPIHQAFVQELVGRYSNRSGVAPSRNLE